MNEKEPPKHKSIPRQVVMKEVFDQNYRYPRLPAECVGCKNRPDLPCEGCDHWAAKKAAMQSKELAAAVVGTLDSPTQMRHRIVEAIMAKQHSIEEEVDVMVINNDNDALERSERMVLVEGLKMAVEIARRTE